MAERGEIRDVKAAHKAAIMSRQNVVGVGIGQRTVAGQATGELALTVLVSRKIAPSGLPPGAMVPEALAAVPTDVVEVGELRAQQSRTDRFRPAPGGVSIGHFRISAGTMGVVVRDRDSGDRLILSNNHVLANNNDAVAGDPILQPGGADGGREESDTIARLERFCPLAFNVDEPGGCALAAAYAGVGNVLAAALGSSHRVTVQRINPQATNEVDAAVARPLNDDDVLDDILQIGEVSGTVEAELGMAVRKSGRTTGFTEDTITVVDATVTVQYGAGRVATFENQLVAGPMSQGGDSGSLVVSGDPPRAVGLLFAGSPQSTIFNPIQAVLDCLNVEI